MFEIGFVLVFGLAFHLGVLPFFLVSVSIEAELPYRCGNKEIAVALA